MRSKTVRIVLAMAFAMVLLPLATVGSSNDSQTVDASIAGRAPTSAAGPVPTDTPVPVPDDPPTLVPTATAVRCRPSTPTAARAGPVPTDTPPPVPKPTPLPIEYSPHSAAEALSEFFPWFLNPPDDTHASVVQPLVEVWLQDAELGRELARAPWLSDGIGVKEYNPIYGLSRLFDLDPALARRMLAYSMEEPVRNRNVFPLSALGDMTWQHPERLDLLRRQPWFTDGLSPEERAFIVPLTKVAAHDAIYRDLLAFHTAQSTTISLPLAGEVRLWVFHHAPLSPDENILAAMERSVRGVERMTAMPFPRSDVIVLLVNGSAYGETAFGGVNHGDSLIIIRDNEQDPIAGLLNHEIAHYFFVHEIGPFWLVEGGANFAQAYIDAWAGSATWAGPVPANEPIRTICAENGFPHMHALSDPDPQDRTWQVTCQYALGQYFLTNLFNTLGASAFSAALRDLYGLYLQLQFYPTEEQVYRTFLRHAPPDREAAFLEVYRRLHGGPFLDGN